MFSSLTQIAKDSDWLKNAPQLTHLPKRLVIPSNFWSGINSLKQTNSTDYKGGHRIGFYYQWLVQQLLIKHPTYKLLAEEVQVNDNGRTLGSVDFLVEAPGEEIEHWEVAVKFYLAYENQWYGPNAKDTLAKKQQKMLDHQLLITDTKAYQDQFPEMKPAHRRLLMQGRLYVNPWLDDSHIDNELAKKEAISGFWCWSHQLPSEKHFSTLNRGQWMALPDENELETMFNADSIKPVERAQHLLDENHNHWFVVPDSWPNM